MVKLTTEVNLENQGASKLDQLCAQWPYLERIHLPRYGAGITSLSKTRIFYCN